ncbi:oligoribonuclease [Buchnera aphidicola]|uniref:oligoribonuclease n=1 Tax=Buchnera aphidicola TaxID=9 RepID=UPI002093480D|nr:oligoribonuclease [Buchnera aphidicola]USS94114.1 oligoribonuclease [Buchnera aphidicola (Sipha maydis)]
MTKKIKKNLIWIDLEMTGLYSEIHKILEIAVIVTDGNLNILENGMAIPIYQNKQEIEKMDHWNQKTHSKTGLIEKVKKSKYNEKKAEKKILLFLKKITIQKKSPLCGNTVWKDREFLKKYMPKLESYFHYRNIDTSTIQELYKRWKNNQAKKFHKKNQHSALQDIQESIDELIFYKKNFFNI